MFVGEFRKILGIYFCSSIKHYVKKNWMETFFKCKKVMDIWEQEHLSMIGRVLILNIKVIPKIFYLLQSIEPVKYWQDRLNLQFSKFIGGGSSSIPLSILEWGRDRGGLGLFSIVQKARSLRFKFLKDFLCRLNSKELTPINSILGYYLDIPIISRYRPNMAKTGQVCYGGAKKVIDRGNMRKSYFQCFLEDIAWYTKMEDMYIGVDTWSQKEFYKKLNEYEGNVIRRGNQDLLKIYELHLSSDNEHKLWNKVFLKSLCTKIQSFNFKLVHGALPTMDEIGGKSTRFKNKFCYYCKEMLNFNYVETDVHVLLECSIAKAVWFRINDRLRAAHLDTIMVNKQTIFYKIGMATPQAHLVSEVNWALWTNRCSNVYDETLNSHFVVLKKLFYHLKLLSKVDKVLLSIRAYHNRWLGLNQAIEALDI